MSATVLRHFLFGGTQRPNIVSGQDILVAGNITDRITASVSDNLYYNKAAFATSAINTFGNAPRTLGIYSPWRNSIDLSVSKNVTVPIGRPNVSPGPDAPAVTPSTQRRGRTHVAAFPVGPAVEADAVSSGVIVASSGKRGNK